jgi:hypothetical protein
MNWLFRWLSRKIERANLEKIPANDWRGGLSQLSSASVREDSLNSDGMSFKIHRASGGMVVEHNHYDRKTDENHNSIHIITDDQDLGEQLAKIITIEMLRR